MHNILDKLTNILFKRASIAPLVVLRIVFGSLLFFSTVRTLQKGWVTELYVKPTFHFSFFSWLKPLDAEGMLFIYTMMSICALGIIVGFFYRISVFIFLILFTYVELLDKTYYLNHYYLASLLVFWLMLVPANRSHSIDALLFPQIRSATCSNWHLLIFKIQLSIVYFFAGLAKVNPDWILHAQPLATWLPGKYQLPILGQFMHYKATAFFFSWAGCLYDLSIWVFLWIKRSRGLAYVLVLVFHVLTAILFPRIGMFPFIMITSTIIFFSSSWHQKLLSYFPFNRTTVALNYSRENPKRRHVILALLMIYIVVQLYLPLRYLQYSGNLFWHEKGYRFSWRVMLMEKNGFASIILKDPKKETQKEIDQDAYLTPFQQQQMKSQPDLLLQFAKHIGDQFLTQNGYAPQVYVKSRISLNGRRSQLFTDETVDVYAAKNPLSTQWIIPLKER